MDEQTVEVIQQLMDWHKNGVEALETILKNPDAEIRLGKDTVITDPKVLQGVNIGVKLAMWQLGKLPISLNEAESLSDG